MFTIINLKKLAEESDIDYFKIRNNLQGAYNSFDVNDRTKLANAAFGQLQVFFNRLGFKITMERMEDRYVEEKSGAEATLD